jgi:hypothetical protein
LLLIYATLIQLGWPELPFTSPPEGNPEEDQDNGMPPPSCGASEGHGSGNVDDVDPEGAFPANQTWKRTSLEQTTDQSEGDDNENDTGPRGGQQPPQRRPAKKAKPVYVSSIQY